MKTTTSKERSQEIADRIEAKYLSDKTRAERNFMERVIKLSKEDPIDTWESLMTAQGFLIEIACLLSDPEISGKLSEEFYRKNAGKILTHLTQQNAIKIIYAALGMDKFLSSL
jgi:hypothetical protein